MSHSISASEAKERTTVQKLQVRLLPFLMLLYVLAFLDRINIGFAALTMNKDLNINSHEFGLAVGVFFLGYLLLGIPSNVMLHKVGANTWVTVLLVVWGGIAALMGLMQNVTQLYIARFALGLAESGFFPGVLLYLTYWFRQREQARAVALFMTAMPLTSILGSPLSGLILDHVHWFGLAPWRWLLILEGCPALLLGILAYFLLPIGPSQAGFLSQEEKNWLNAEIQREASQKRQTRELSPLQTLAHGRVWHLAIIGFAHATGFYSFSFWMPQAVKALSSLYSNTQIGFLVMVPHLAGLLGMVLISRSSDRRFERKYHIAVPLLVGAIGFLCLSFAHAAFAAITFWCLAALGLYGIFGPYYASASAFLGGYSAATGIALITSTANLGGFAGPYTVGVFTHKTGSMSAGLIVAGIAVLLSAELAVLLPKD